MRSALDLPLLGEAPGGKKQGRFALADGRGSSGQAGRSRRGLFHGDVQAKCSGVVKYGFDAVGAARESNVFVGRGSAVVAPGGYSAGVSEAAAQLEVELVTAAVNTLAGIVDERERAYVGVHRNGGPGAGGGDIWHSGEGNVRVGSVPAAGVVAGDVAVSRERQ